MNDLFAQPELLNLPVHRAAYSNRAALLMAAFSWLAYSPFEGKQLSTRLEPGGFRLVQTFNRGGTQAFLARNDRFAVLAFRGTEKDYRDITADIDARLRKTPLGGEVHTGFYRAYHENVAAPIRAAIDALAVPFYLTGHSLGGALAIISAEDLTRDSLAACYTYGSPRVGDAEFVRALDKVPVYRVVNDADPVPRLPLLAMGYRHVGDVRFLTARGGLVRSPSVLQTAPAFLVPQVTFRPQKLFECHRISAYHGKLAAIAGVGER